MNPDEENKILNMDASEMNNPKNRIWMTLGKVLEGIDRIDLSITVLSNTLSHRVEGLSTELTKLGGDFHDREKWGINKISTLDEQFNSVSRLNKITIFLLLMNLGLFLWVFGIPVFP